MQAKISALAGLDDGSFTLPLVLRNWRNLLVSKAGFASLKPQTQVLAQRATSDVRFLRPEALLSPRPMGLPRARGRVSVNELGS